MAWMSAQKVDLKCKNCGQVFSAFLEEMARRNAKVVCPGCGKTAEYTPAHIGKDAN
jgi:Zn finger protein HypA/HybF involved in hydrogenase expression